MADLRFTSWTYFEEEIDKIISAEIPDPNVDQELFEIVTTNMAHGPCGTLNIMSPCMEWKMYKTFSKTMSNWYFHQYLSTIDLKR